MASRGSFLGSLHPSAVGVSEARRASRPFSPFAMAFSFTGSKSQASATNEQKEALKQRVSTEIAMANAQQLISKATDKCYTKCVPTPGSSLSSKEQTCAERCLERYFEAFNIVSATYVRRIAAERASGALATEAA